MRRGARRRRAASGAAVLASAAALAAVPWLVSQAADTLGQSTTGRIEITDPVTELPFTPATLYALEDEGEVVGLTVAAVAPQEQGGTLVSVPVGASVLLGDPPAPARVGDAWAGGDDEALQTAVEGLLGITFSDMEVLDGDELVDRLRPFEPFDVLLADPVVDTDASGTEQTLFEPGEQSLSAEEAVSVLTARRANEGEIARIGNVAAVWQAVADKAGMVEDAPDDGALTQVLAGPATARSLTAQPVLDLVSNPSGIDLLATDPVEIVTLMAETLPSAVSPVNPGPRVRLIDQTDTPGALREAVLRLVFTGANVVFIERGDPNQTSVTWYSDPDQSTRLGNLERILGPMRFEVNQERLDGVDATVTLGEDFVGFWKGNVTLPTAVATEASQP